LQSFYGAPGNSQAFGLNNSMAEANSSTQPLEEVVEIINTIQFSTTTKDKKTSF
jgi:hypothetical protein